ncbi:ATP-binding protein [Chelatococcus reniformis]|uniref:ATP-binding protein n=1 Tax=Chelatococcus reniformis TaxID=1494448 RepID=UPI001FCECAFF|nr:ATP-binding protein [Chelatococcus reniformis]
MLLLAIILVHAGLLLLYRRSAIASADEAFAQQVATQLAIAREAMLRRSPAERAGEARALSSPHFEIGWAANTPVGHDEHANAALRALRTRVLTLEPGLGAGLALSMEGPADALHQQDLRGAVALSDGSFLTFRSAHSPRLALLGPWVFLSTVMTILVGLAAVGLVHRIARPLRVLNQAADRIGRERPVLVPEIGPEETRNIGRSLNAMQERIRSLVGERTQALAAVSHDLRTPIARLRLQIDDLPEEDRRASMMRDLDDMLTMIDTTLAYLRGDSNPEAQQVINVASLIISIADAMADSGHDVAYQGPTRAVARVRPVALRRAVINLADNAVRYGLRARLALEPHDEALVIRVDDDGPGLAAEDVERVFEPFVRLETSRNRSSGGTGLGLTIARHAIETEGSTVTLTTRPEGGLRAQFTLPRHP